MPKIHDRGQVLVPVTARGLWRAHLSCHHGRLPYGAFFAPNDNFLNAYEDDRVAWFN
jgi:hypothetical protein